MAKERMDQDFAVFNLHVNAAGKKADREFKAQFGQDVFDEHIAPLRRDGIMAIFQRSGNELADALHMAWVVLCTMYVNEKVPYRLTPEGPQPVKRRRKAAA